MSILKSFWRWYCRATGYTSAMNQNNTEPKYRSTIHPIK
jgi:hypothetical protein